MEQVKPADNPDIAQERRQATFEVEILTHVYHGGKQNTIQRRKWQKKALAYPGVTPSSVFHFMDRPEQYSDGVRKTIEMLRLAQEGDWNMESLFLTFLISHPFENASIGLHPTMFIPTIATNGTEEQKQKWLPGCHTFQIIGTFAQTEMGHGTHVRGLETTATYDPKTEEFILHSPTVTSIKFWPGGLGKTTNHAVVMAQLYTEGRCLGVHPFVVQTRSLDDHQPMPGVTVGDIGTKFGYACMDNGFLKLNHVRIPRENMLARYSEVLKDGSYVKKDKAVKKPTYAAMVLTRVGLMSGVNASGLAAAVTIATRYSVVRRQSTPAPGTREAQVLDFQTHQHRLLPWLATAYAIKFVAQFMVEVFETTSAAVKTGNHSSVPEMHALSAGLKAYTSYTTTFGLEQCRLVCGGHGYSQASGIPKIYYTTSPACTYEGENTVMYLQTARYLMKVHQRALTGESIPSSVAYLSEAAAGKCSISAEFTLDSLVGAYQYRARRMIQRAAQRLQKRQAAVQQMSEAWNTSSVDLVKAAEAHCQLFTLIAFVEKIGTVNDKSVAMVLTQLCQLFALHGITQQLMEYVEEGYMTRSQIDLTERRVLSLLADIRPNAVALVDAFDFSDHQLGSVLGRFDGHVYDNLYKWVAESPLNHPQENMDVAHKNHIKHLLQMDVASKL